MVIEQAYAKVAAKYKLPPFEVLDAELDLSACESETNPLHDVRERIADKVDFWLKLLDSVLSPDPAHTASSYESRFFTETERTAVFVLYKRLMIIDRTIVEAAIVSDEKTDAAAIRDVWNEWNDVKKEVLAVARKMKASWGKTEKREEELGYMG
jgi:hypothetical protein